MIKQDEAIFKGMLKILKDGSSFNIMQVAKNSGVSRQTIYNKIEKNTFQDLEKIKRDFKNKQLL